MSWQPELTIIVRDLINDTDPANYEFTDCRIEQCLVVAAQLAKFDLGSSLTTTYTIDVDNLVISPDPTTSDPKDEAFMVICSFKAAIMIMNSTIKTYAKSSFMIKDQLSTLDMKNIVQNMKPLLDNLIKQYDDMVDDYKRDANSVGLSILSPYSPGSYNFYGGGDHRDNGTYFY